jgi:hypothetical protein
MMIAGSIRVSFHRDNSILTCLDWWGFMGEGRGRKRPLIGGLAADLWQLTTLVAHLCMYVEVGSSWWWRMTSKEEGGYVVEARAVVLCLPVAAWSEWHYYCDMQAPLVCLHPSVFPMMPALMSTLCKVDLWRHMCFPWEKKDWSIDSLTDIYVSVKLL